MEQVTAPDEPPRYRAFISYSHADARFAQWLHRKLESFHIPAADGDSGDRLNPVFIDRAELAAGPDLSRQVREALAQSAALVVIASPAARASHWVAQEIALFRSLHPDRPVLAALIEGEPAEAFPEPLLVQDGEALEPLAADFRKDKDGRRLGLIKIAAGLTGLPLDRLVQRDAQARQRRVMAITALALTLVVVLATLLVLAIRERAEAQRQRAEAEGMVEFMLTDLRDRLQSVGRLDVMEAVNRKAMEHYAGETNLDGLPSDVLLRRVRLLTAMGDDDNTSGRRPEARRKFAEAYRITDDLLRREPDNPERIFNHAQSGYWVGHMDFLEKNRAGAQPYMDAYLRLAQRLVEIDKTNITWRRELGYAYNNLCSLSQLEPVDSARGLPHCREAVVISEWLTHQMANDITVHEEYLSNLGWQSDAELIAGNADEALALRQLQREHADSMSARFPNDVRTSQAKMLAALGFGGALAELGRDAEARAAGRRALEIADTLRARDPGNAQWARWRNTALRLIDGKGSVWASTKRGKP